MKVIVLGTVDGRLKAYAYNHANLLPLLQYANELGMIDGGIPDNPTMEQLELIVAESPWINRQWDGAKISIVDLKDSIYE
jgi:hypothetical protein